MQEKVRKHIPDFLLLTREGPLVVDVKPSRRLETPEVAFTFRLDTPGRSGPRVGVSGAE